MKTEFTNEYRVSPRVVLRPGDVFRAKGGPYWQGSDGEKISLTGTGPYKFFRAAVRGSCQWIEATDKHGHFAVLRVSAGRWKRIDPSLVPRPYVITGKRRKKKCQ